MTTHFLHIKRLQLQNGDFLENQLKLYEFLDDDSVGFHLDGYLHLFIRQIDMYIIILSRAEEKVESYLAIRTALRIYACICITYIFIFIRVYINDNDDDDVCVRSCCAQMYIHIMYKIKYIIFTEGVNRIGKKSPN